MRARTRRRLIWGAALVALLLLVAVGAAAYWVLTPLGPSDEALAALEGSEAVEVSETEYGWDFVPAGVDTKTGVIVYPGGRVDARSYAPLALDIAEEGHLVALVRMPLNLAVLAPGTASQVVEAHPGIEVWVLSGHSLGGAMASRWVLQHPDAAQGLVLLAAYPPGGDDLSGLEARTVSLVGDLDGLVSVDEIMESLPRLPEGTEPVVVSGGNHAQWGSYGEQPGDEPATISEEEQRASAVDAYLYVLTRASRRGSGDAEQ
jgi:hypothetical protein